MKATEPFDGWPWALAPAVIEHIAARLGDAIYDHAAERDEVLACPRPRYSEDGDDGLICRWPRDDGGINNPLRRAACVALKVALAKGKVRAKDPLGAPIEPEWWKFAEISEGGSAVNLSSGRKLDHVEVCVEDVLRIWPLAAVEVEKPAGDHTPPPTADADTFSAVPPPSREPGKRGPSQRLDVERALRKLYPAPAPRPTNRKAAQKAVEAEIGREFSPKTLDRALGNVWPIGGQGRQI